MNILPKFKLSDIPVPETDLYFNTQHATHELIQLANQSVNEAFRAAAIKMEVARTSRSFTVMRSAWIDLTNIAPADLGFLPDDMARLGFQTKQMIDCIGRALQMHAPQNGSET